MQAPPHQARTTVGLVLAASGLLLTGYLTYTNLFDTHAAYCGAGSSCDLVQGSRWSTLLGVPLPALGFATYAIIGALLVRFRRLPRSWLALFCVTVFGVVFSSYLTAISIFEIEATCGYCLTSYAVLAALLVVVVMTRPQQLPGFNWPSFETGGVGAAALLTAVLHLHYSGTFDPAAGPEDPKLKALAIHLKDSGAVFYGAYWCPRCQAQKALFKASVDRLPYQECTPQGRDGLRALACVNNSIRVFPTWIINDQHYEGLLEPETLSSLSGFVRNGD